MKGRTTESFTVAMAYTGECCLGSHLEVTTVSQPDERKAEGLVRRRLKRRGLICDLTLELGEYVNGQFVTFAESLADGGHIAGSEADARKGAYTNAFKKAAAFFGVGRQAYEGSLDDDNVPIDEVPGQSRRHLSVAPHPQPRSQAQPTAAPALPAPTAPSLQTPAPQTTSGPTRNRLTSNQLSAIWSLSRKLGWAQAEFRARVKQKYGVTLEFLDRASASKLISELQLQPVPNGHAGEMPAEPGAAG